MLLRLKNKRTDNVRFILYSSTSLTIIPMLPSIEQRLAVEIAARHEQVAAAIALLDEGATVPFIARYRKEATGGLDDIQLRLLEARLAKLEMKLEVSPAALSELAKVGFDPLFGARPLKRAIQQRIENPVSKLILQGRFGPKDVIPVDVENGEFSFARVVH